jgi:hypothetical protein
MCVRYSFGTGALVPGQVAGKRKWHDEKMRERVRELFDMSEEKAAELERTIAMEKSLTWRRRILNWFERG